MRIVPLGSTSRARNLAQRGGLTKKEMLKKHGRFPKKNEWWGEDGSYKKWKEKWIVDNPKESEKDV